MAKSKKKRGTVQPMALDVEETNNPEEMDTSEVPVLSIRVPKIQSGIKKKHGQQRRAQKLRKKKALEKALSSNEKQKEKTNKTQLKLARVQALKSLY